MVYTLKGGFEAVVWTDVVQGVIIWTGIFVCLGYLLFLPPGGPGGGVRRRPSATTRSRFGSTAFDFSQPTVWVLIIYGFFWYLQRYTADQTLVQRYLAAKSDRAAVRGVALGALLCGAGVDAVHADRNVHLDVLPADGRKAAGVHHEGRSGVSRIS